MTKAILSFAWEVLKITLIALLIVVPIRYFVFQPFFVIGQSMEPNFHNGDYLIVDEITYRFSEPERGDVLVFKFPDNPSFRYIKRAIGLPGEKIEIKDGKVIITNDKEEIVLDESNYLSSSIKTTGDISVVLENNEYFVLGDNRSYSSDSRRWGVLPRENIIGKVFLRAWPITAFAKFGTPAY